MAKMPCAIFLVTWSLWVMPALCMGGMLQHVCAQDQVESHKTTEPDCGHEHHQHQTPYSSDEVPHFGSARDGACSHEADCESDPCSGTVVTAGRVLMSGFDTQPVCLSEHSAIQTTVGTPGIVTVGRLVHGCAVTALPCFDSDLPALI